MVRFPRLTLVSFPRIAGAINSIGQDFILLCAAANLHRLAQLGLRCIKGGAAAKA
jgi:hypothetical protein